MVAQTKSVSEKIENLKQAMSVSKILKYFKVVYRLNQIFNSLNFLKQAN